MYLSKLQNQKKKETKREKKNPKKNIFKHTHTQHDGKGFSVHLRDIPSFTAWRMGSKRKEPTEHSSILMTFH